MLRKFCAMFRMTNIRPYYSSIFGEEQFVEFEKMTKSAVEDVLQAIGCGSHNSDSLKKNSIILRFYNWLKERQIS